MIPADWLNNLAVPFARRKAGTAVVGALGGKTAYAFRGSVREGGPAPAPDTLFELGAITQIFTATLAAVAAREGRLALDRPIAEIAPKLAGLPAWITPIRLATHTAGIPRLPPAITRQSLLDMANPYAGFSRDDLLAWAASYRPKREPSETGYAASILGMALLGLAVSLAFDLPFDEALKQRLLEPLGMADTLFNPDEDRIARMATPHDRRGKPVEPWRFGGLIGAGGLRSTAADMGRFLTAVLAAGKGSGDIDGAIRDTLEIRRRAPRADGEGGGLGWLIVHAGKPPAFIHRLDARTNGSQALIAIAPGPGLAAVVMANRGPRGRDALRPPRQEFLKSFVASWSLPSMADESGTDAPDADAKA